LQPPARVRYILRTVLPEKLARQLDYSLESLPTPFARLVFLASLRDPYTGQYLHEGWGTIAAVGDIHQALEKAHREIFSAVVALPLGDFCAELGRHFASLNQPQAVIAKLWLEIEPYREMVPQGCSAIERGLFVAQIRLALEALKRLPQLGGEQEPAASPRQQPDPPPQPRYLN
jgi:hypothetical protein